MGVADLTLPVSILERAQSCMECPTTNVQLLAEVPLNHLPTWFIIGSFSSKYISPIQEK